MPGFGHAGGAPSTTIHIQVEHLLMHIRDEVGHLSIDVIQQELHNWSKAYSQVSF